MLILERPWTRQPQVAVGINWSNPLAKNLVFCAPLSRQVWMRDLVQGQTLTNTGIASSAANVDGVYPEFGASKYVDVPNVPSGVTSTSPVTFAWTQEPRSTSAYSALLDVKLTGATNSFLIFQSATDANYYFVVGRRSGTSAAAILFSAIGAVTNNRRNRFLLVCSAGVDSTNIATFWLFSNGVKLTTSSTSTLGASTTAGFRIGGLLGATTDPFEGLIGDVNLWSRALSDAQAISWCNNPWQIFSPRRIYIPTATAAGYTHPTLSLATATEIGATSFKPSVTYTFA